MYTNRYSSPKDLATVYEFIKEFSFGILVSAADNKPIATHIPFLLLQNEAGEYYLEGHIAKANPQWKSFTQDSEVLVIFSEPHAYISSSWYEILEVPTWNYISVQVSGPIKILEQDELYALAKRLVDHFEAGQEKPFKMEALDPKDAERQLKGIVGFHIEMKDVQANFKLSQNRTETDFQHVVDHLNAGGAQDQRVATEMKKYRES